MASINLFGLASGLPPNLIEQMMDAERIPIRAIEDKKAKSENRLQLVNDLESKVIAFRESLSELASTRSFNDMTLTSGDPNIIAGQVDPQAAGTGSWSLEILELPEKAAVLTNGFPDKDKTTLGTGYFRFETPDGEKEVYLKDGNNTLAGAAAAINSAGVGVRASVIQDEKNADEPFKLMLSTENSGTENTIVFPRLYLIDGDRDVNFETERKGKNGRIKLDGIELEVDDTRLNNLIPGVSLDIKQAVPGRPISIGVAENHEAVSGKIKTFVDSANAVLGFIQSQNKMDQKTDTSKTLGGDSILRNVETRMRRLILNPQMGTGEISRLNQLGVEFNRAGTLTFKEEKFNKVLAESPQAVRNFFMGDGFATGLVPSIRREVGAIIDSSNGVLGNRKRGLDSKIDQMDRSIESKERNLQKREEFLRQKFARMEETVSKLKSQGAALSGMGGG